MAEWPDRLAGRHKFSCKRPKRTEDWRKNCSIISGYKHRQCDHIQLVSQNRALDMFVVMDRSFHMCETVSP